VRALIVCPQPIAAEAGLAALRAGGSAVDAAVTIAFCQGVLDPQMCGIGGCGVMVVYRSDKQRSEVIEFYARAGSRVSAEMWEAIFRGESGERYNFFVDGNVNDLGYASVGVPGTVAGLALAVQRPGRLGWAAALQPAIRLAREGFAVNGGLRALWTTVPTPGQVGMPQRLQVTQASTDLYTNQGDLKQLGELLVQDDYGNTLETLAHDGPDAFYNGEIAARIADDFGRNGGFISQQDLSEYAARVVEPIETNYRGLRVVVPPPPAGGMTLIQMLNILERYDLRQHAWPGLEASRLRIEAMGWAFADRQRYLADPLFTDVPVARLIDKQHARAAQLEIDRGRRFAVGARLKPRTRHTCASSIRKAMPFL
jgi:gamma-glutamyltranspeptidase / glutathione hydrolase